MTADKGLASAMFNYAAMLEEGDGIPMNREEEARYYEMAIEKDNVTAIYNYALLLDEWTEIPTNKENQFIITKWQKIKDQ